MEIISGFPRLLEKRNLFKVAKITLNELRVAKSVLDGKN